MSRPIPGQWLQLEAKLFLPDYAAPDVAEQERARLAWWYSLTPEQQAIQRRAWNETHPEHQIQ